MLTMSPLLDENGLPDRDKQFHLLGFFQRSVSFGYIGLAGWTLGCKSMSGSLQAFPLAARPGYIHLHCIGGGFRGAPWSLQAVTPGGIWCKGDYLSLHWRRHDPGQERSIDRLWADMGCHAITRIYIRPDFYPGRTDHVIPWSLILFCRQSFSQVLGPIGLSFVPCRSR